MSDSWLTLTFTLHDRFAMGDTEDPHRYLQSFIGDIGLEDANEDRTHIGSVSGYVIDLEMMAEEGESPFEVMDSVDTDMAGYLTLLDANDEIRGDITDETWGNLLIIDRVTVLPQWRGHGHGLCAAARTILTLGASCSIAALHPTPYDGERPTGDELVAAQAKLSAHWAKLGFVPLEGSELMTLRLTLAASGKQLREMA